MRRVVLALVAALALLAAGCGGGAATAPPAAAPATSAAAAAPAARASTLPAVAVAELPPEARETLALIDAGGPFPYAKDGATFQNREGILPPHRGGWYEEYTVPTPGEDDRGARRIVAGQDGERYYTDDHYASFREIVP